MKKTLLFLLISFFAVLPAMADGPAISFKNKTHDFGTIKSTKGAVSYEYAFTNTGDKPLVIVNVTNGGCGCTTPEFPKEPIAPGKTGKIKITFNPEGRRGEFRREVKVKTNVSSKRESLRFNGVIVP
ncbi:MAG: DUF1573 domain-containing protein [Paramuribaculum sp.]|nr:DUF1573 domain-containing protein [Paramuribaculum sp.]